ncbi:Aste57867_14967 [Aphanomyces stellatus]|uniref:GPI mannosyltransferase 2 n=1 Tax=Aphanomyces stellatus TaxID=120398 RepID=A0A485L3U2_9STRA|nr:hypothetical protein As57867_014911 [Aphanomyces stellatus]VFT91781.1 Aste57867_14967 [Aphanomyces stellatus]
MPVGSEDVVAAAVISRVWVTSMALTSHFFITPYDTSAITHSNSIFSAFAAWDGVYFVDIAADGYRYENTHAFFPLFPLLVRWTSVLFTPFVDETAALLVAGWCISNVCFVLAAHYLHLLGRVLLKNDALATRAALFFCFCPSGIFMSSCYSESLMCFLSFCGMYLLELYRTASSSSSRRYLHLFLSALLFGLASATRSNGLLLSLYIAYYRLCDSPHPVTDFPRFFVHWIVTACLGVVAIGLQLVYFVYGIAAYCPSHQPYLSMVQQVFVIDSKLTQDRPWCANVIPNFSAMYMFIQHEYWGVGPFAYYQLKQIPNFLLAGPMISLAAYSVVTLRHPTLRPYIVHIAFLLANALVVVHIQVITRFLAASPPIFWAAATLLDDVKSATSTSLSWLGHGLVLYFLIFNVVGATLFPSFYPWT